MKLNVSTVAPSCSLAFEYLRVFVTLWFVFKNKFAQLNDCTYICSQIAA